MFMLGVVLFIAGTILIFASGGLVKRGKIKDVKTLFKVKYSGLALVIISALLMYYGQ